ncbi:EAL domain-containing protein [Paenibacillus fonticola]|uniref:EAL domain-containing protein n=1 Tax=Paenibacillus fonticola TaxID=379896 RepID=UPI000369C85E|nr:EAL domain-containing protein [Paenibacillus fonticola]
MITKRRRFHYTSGIIFLAGLALALFSEYHPLHLIFGISLIFTNLVLFLLTRVYGIGAGISAALIVYTLSIFAWGNPYFQGILLLEIIFVSLSLRWKKRIRTVVGADFAFWVTLGTPLFLLLYYASYQILSIEAWLLAVIYISNGLFNVLMADVIWEHLPRRFFQTGVAAPEQPIYLSKLLYYIIFLAISLPFLFYLVINSRNTYDAVRYNSLQVALTTSNSISNEIDRWSPYDIRSLGRLGRNQVEGLQQIVKHFAADDLYHIIIFDPKTQQIVADSQNVFSDRSMEKFLLPQADPIQSDDFTLHLQQQQPRLLPNQEWQEASYIYGTTLKRAPLTLYMRVPLLQYQEKIYGQYLTQFSCLLLFTICAAMAGKWFTRRLVRGLSELAEVTTGLPGKVYSLHNLDWPESRIQEIRSLTLNFRQMTNKLLHIFQESLKSNQLLQEQTMQLQQSEKKLQELAYYDGLTGLPNRLHFTEYIGSLGMHYGPEHPFAVMFADLNRFKQVNDTLGHEMGDILLQQVASRFSLLVTDQLRVFRLSGDEFVFVYHYNDTTSVQQAAQAICDALNEPVRIHDVVLYVSVSIGISIYPYDGDNLDLIMRNADIAMYAAKEQGDSIYHFYDQIIENQRSENMKLENSLRNALLSGQFSLNYQPKIDALTGRICGAEALIRWLHPEYGSVPPDKFIPLAETSGIILDIDEWVVTEACRQNKAWQEQGLPRFPIAINLSARHFYQGNLLGMISRVLKKTELAPEDLILEITEGSLIKSAEYVIKVMSDLRAMGITISLDDFGTGYSSLSQLQRLPIHEMKLDRSFIQGLAHDSKKSAIVRAVIELGHHMELDIVAEGIESEEELHYLRNLKCDQFQGYLFSRPLPNDEFIHFIRDWNDNKMNF